MWYKELKELRLAAGMQAKELAERVGKSATYISRIESGAIINTSFELVSSIAKVISETEAVKSGKVDLSKYSSDFSRMVLSYRYNEMKDVYDYVNQNKHVEEYSNIIRYLNPGDIDVFQVIAKYRAAESEFNTSKKKLEEAVLAEMNMKSIDEVIKSLDKEGYEININIKIPADEIIKGDYSMYLNLITDEIKDRTEDVSSYGIEAIIEGKPWSGVISNSEDDIEIELQEPVMIEDIKEVQVMGKSKIYGYKGYFEIDGEMYYSSGHVTAVSSAQASY